MASKNIETTFDISNNTNVNYDDDIAHNEFNKNDDLVLSDIHIENLPLEKNLDNLNKCISEINFILPTRVNSTSSKQEFDEDGDMIIKRPIKYKILIEHYLETNLKNVGLQLWKASLYLCDYIIENSKLLFNSTINVVEFGSGIGLTSLICSLFTNKIMCTDLEPIIKLAENNFNLNKKLLDDLNPNELDLRFKSLDWINHENLFKNDDHEQKCSKTDKTGVFINSYYNLNNNEDIEYLKNANLFLAADVIYDDNLSVSFLNLLFKLMSRIENQPKIAYIALEKRINFELTTLGSGSSCYDFFEQSMFELNDYYEDKIIFKTERVNLNDLTKYIFNYERSDYLVIWKVTSGRI